MKIPMFTHSAQHDGQCMARHSILDNYKELMELWELSLSVVSETEIKARIRSVQSFMGKFGFLFGCYLGKLLLSQTYNLLKTIQKPETSAVKAQSLAKSLLSVLVTHLMKAFSSFRKEVSSPKSILMSMTPKCQERGKYHQDSKVANMNHTIIMKIQRINTNKFTTELLTEYLLASGRDLSRKTTRCMPKWSAVYKQSCSEYALNCAQFVYGDDFCNA